MQDRDPPAPPSSHEVAGEDFLFHLYRGSELLQDNRVHDAKAELEQALRFQPSDPKGQDLLGIVYFRLGLYPRAIAIYEKLVHSHPDAIEPRVNLALSYLKTGQASSARFELERVVEQNPHHSRAWGYLGLAFQRLGDYERASHAFAAGGHDVMARRLLDMAMQSSPSATVTVPPSLVPEQNGARETRRPPAMTVEVRSAGSEPLAPASSRVPSVSASTWTAIDPGEGHAQPAAPDMATALAAATTIPSAAPSIEPHGTPPPGDVYTSGHGSPAPTGVYTSSHAHEAPADVYTSSGPHSGRGQLVPPPAVPGTTFSASPSAPPPSVRPRSTSPLPVAQALRDALVVYPRALPIARHPSGLVLVQAADGFAVRLEVVRSMALTGPAGEPLPRRVRGRVTDEPLGGAASPLLQIPGKSELCLSAREREELLPLTLTEEPLYLREDALAGFEPSVTYENGRLPVGDGDAIAMVQLRGPGTIVAALPEHHHAVEVIEGRNVTVRAQFVVAWSGRLLPRALFASEAPAGARGLVAFTGEGMVLLDGRG